MKAAVIVSVVVMFLLPSGHCKMQVASNHEVHSKQWLQFMSARARGIEKRQVVQIGTCTSEEFVEHLSAAGYPQDCASDLQRATSDAVNSLGQISAESSLGQISAESFLNYTSAVTAVNEIYCRPECGNPLITANNQCGLPELSDSLRQVCSRNEDGDLCYERFGNILTDEIQVQFNCNGTSSCTASCQGALRAISGNSGCCLNAFNNTLSRAAIASANMIYGSIMNITSSIVHYDLWYRCNVTTPGFCSLESSTLAESSTRATSTLAESSTLATSRPTSSAVILNFTKVLILLTSVVMVALL